MPDNIWEYPFSYMHIVSWPTFIGDMNVSIKNAIQIRDRIGNSEGKCPPGLEIRIPNRMQAGAVFHPYSLHFGI